MRKDRKNKNHRDENVNYDGLEQHEYDDSEGFIFYTCPLCGGEYLADFIVKENGQTMCIDCWDKRYNN
jgi:formylmethanofuran dehydrogenase subunit E